MFPFYFSGVNSSMLSPNPGDSINLSWNIWNAKNAANSIMFMTPSFNTAFYDFPDVMTFGNSLLDPRLAIQQTLNSFNNGGWMNGMNAGGNWFNNIFKNPWQNSDNSNTGKTDKEKAENKLMQKQYDKLKAVLKSYKENSKELTDEQEAKLETALNKGGKIEEKLDALKAVYKELDSKELRKALLALDENKKALYDMGYNFNDSEYSFKNTDNDNLIGDITRIETEIGEGQYDILQTYITDTEENNDIIRLISHWNDEHTSDENRSIIRYIATKFPEDSSKQKNAQETVKLMVIQLVNYAKEVSNRIGDCKHLDTAHKELMALLDKTNNDFKVENLNTKVENLNTLAAKFEEVYARIRIAEAEELSAKIRKDYAFLNDISDSDTDFVDNNLVLQDVKADLEAEKITLPSTLDKVKSENTRTNVTKEFLQNPDNLKNGTVTKHTAEENGYQYTVYKYKDKYYEIKNNGNVEQVDNPKIIASEQKNDNDGKADGDSAVTKEKLQKDGKELSKIKFVKRNGEESEVETSKLASGKKYYELDGKIYSIDKNGTVKEEENVKNAEETVKEEAEEEKEEK